MSTQEMQRGPETPQLSAEAQAIVDALSERIDGHKRDTDARLEAMQAQINASNGAGDTPPAPRRRARQTTGEGADDSGDASDRSRDIPAGLPGMGNGNGRGGNGGGRGRGERGDDDRNRGNWKRTALVIGATVVATAVAIVGANKLGLFSGSDESNRPGDTPERVTTPPERGGTNANQQVGPASKLGLSAGEYKRLAPVANERSVDTPGEAVKAYKGANYDQAVQDILSNPEAFQNVDISHYRNRYIHSRAFAPEEISTQNALELKLIGIAQDKANAQSAINLIEGKNITSDRDDSHAEQIEKIREFLLQNTTKIDGNFRLNGLWGNGNVDEKTEKLGVKDHTHNNRRAIRVTGANGAEWIWSLDSASEDDEDLCNNDNERREQPTPLVGTPDSPDGPPPTADREPEPERERRGRPPKVDPDGTPAGVPDRGRGTGTTAGPGPRGPGRGPAGQRVDPGTGRVPGEAPVEAQPQDPTPPRVEAQPAPAVTVDGDGDAEVVGGNPVNTPPATSPEVPANGSTTPAPTQEVNIDG